MLEPADIPQFAVKLKPEGGCRYWYATLDGRAVHHTADAAKFPTSGAARQFANDLARTKPNAFFQIKPL